MLEKGWRASKRRGSGALLALWHAHDLRERRLSQRLGLTAGGLHADEVRQWPFQALFASF